MHSTRLLAAAGVLLAASLPLPAQAPTVVDAPRVICDKLGVTGATVQSLLLPPSEGRPFSVRVVLDGIPRTLELAPHSIRAEGFTFIDSSDGQWTPIDGPAENTYQGTVSGLPGAVAALTLFEGQIAGIVLGPDKDWLIQPATDAMPVLPRTAHVVYGRDQTLPLYGFCASDQPGQAAHGGAADGSGDGNLVLTADMSFELTPAYQAARGGLTNALNDFNTVFNSVNAIYNRDVGVNLVVRQLVTRGDNYSSTNPSTVLSQMRNKWLNARADPHDLAQAWAGFPASGVLGIAYIGSVCTSNRYSVAWYDPSLNVRITVSAHEAGHNFNAQHCSGSTCGIMCASVGGCGGLQLWFGQTSINAITNFAANASCVQ